MEPQEHPDWPLVVELGGPVKVAELLGYSKDGGVQRVQNWKARGIPPAVKLERPDLFLPHLRATEKADAAAVNGAPVPAHPLRRATDRTATAKG